MGISPPCPIFGAIFLCACQPMGYLSSPIGRADLRTALYRIAPRAGVPELVVLLSNGELSCELPDTHDISQEDAVAVCREGAQHVVLRAYSIDSTWSGDFSGVAGANSASVTVDVPRAMGGLYYAIAESRLVEVEGLGRFYAAEESVFLPSLGEGGDLTLEVKDKLLQGSFSLPDAEVWGEFTASPCTSETSMLEVAASNPSVLCSG